MRYDGALFSIPAWSAAAVGLILFTGCRPPKPFVRQDAMRGLVLAGVDVSPMGSPAGMPGLTGSGAPGLPSSLTGRGRADPPRPLLEPAHFPKLGEAIHEETLRRLGEEGVPVAKQPTVGPDGYFEEVDKTGKGELFLDIRAQKREGVVFYDIDIALQQPLYVTPSAGEPVRAYTWRQDVSGGAPEKGAVAAIRKDVEGLVAEFVAAYRAANRAQAE